MCTWVWVAGEWYGGVALEVLVGGDEGEEAVEGGGVRLETLLEVGKNGKHVVESKGQRRECDKPQCPPFL